MGLRRSSALVVLLVFTAIGLFLGIQAFQAIKVAKFSFLTTAAWEPDIHHFGIAGIMADTIFIALVAVIIAIPISLGLSLFISEIAPQKMKRALVSLVDLMAAIPSVVYGLWAFLFLQGRTIGISRWLSVWLGWIPIFKVDGSGANNPTDLGHEFTASTFVCGLAVSLMVVPILTSVMRESFSQAPLGEREGAYALGATRWGMIRSVVLPFGKGGIIGGTMLALGRALGETAAVLIIISPEYIIKPRILEAGTQTVSALIAGNFGDATKSQLTALLAAGFVLFVITLGVNSAAAVIIRRSRSGLATEA
jgi:phosphate transport system permease protein